MFHLELTPGVRPKFYRVKMEYDQRLHFCKSMPSFCRVSTHIPSKYMSLSRNFIVIPHLQTLRVDLSSLSLFLPQMMISHQFPGQQGKLSLFRTQTNSQPTKKTPRLRRHLSPSLRSALRSRGSSLHSPARAPAARTDKAPLFGAEKAAFWGEEFVRALLGIGVMNQLRNLSDWIGWNSRQQLSIGPCGIYFLQHYDGPAIGYLSPAGLR